MSYHSLVVFLMLISGSFAYMCPDYCNCEDSVVTCICNEELEVISLRTPLPEKTDEIRVANCSKVELAMAATSFRTYEKIEFLNINTLSINAFALMGVSINVHFVMENITQLKVASNGFNGLHSVGSLQIRSVKADVVKNFAFGGMLDINEIVISNSVFHELEYLAFHAKNTTSFRIENSSIGRVANTSFELLDMKEVIINETVINIVETEGFSISSVGYFEIQHSEFGLLWPRAFVTENVTELIFENSAILESKPEALLLMKATKSVTFSGNELNNAWQDSILPNRGIIADVESGNLRLRVESNAFRCDCDISWMWDQQSVYQEVLSTSFCIDVQNVSLSLLKPIMDSDGNCTELDFAIEDSTETDISSANMMLLNHGLLFCLEMFLILNLLK